MQCLILQSFILFSIFIVRKATAYNCINTFGDEDCEIRKKAGECENFPE